MQEHGDRPARPGRPSLLSPASQAEPDRQRILSSLDGAAGPAVAARPPPPRRRAWVWGTAALGAIAAAGVVWVARDGDAGAAHPVAESAPAAARVLAQAAPHVTAPPAAPERVDAVQAPRAAVLHETPESAPANPLAELAPAAPARAPGRDTLTRALENPASHGERVARPARKAEPVARAQARAKAKERDKDKSRVARPRAASEPDSDVVLLAALMSHMQPANKKATLEERLDSCKRYNAAGEAQCRARVCEAERKQPACKNVPAPRTAPDT